MPGEWMLINFIAACLATWRIAAALYFEDGPGDVFLRMRNWAALNSGFWYGQLSCFWCCATLAALLVLPFYLWLPWPLYPVAFSGAAVLLTHGGRIVQKEMLDHG